LCTRSHRHHRSHRAQYSFHNPHCCPPGKWNKPMRSLWGSVSSRRRQSKRSRPHHRSRCRHRGTLLRVHKGKIRGSCVTRHVGISGGINGNGIGIIHIVPAKIGGIAEDGIDDQGQSPVVGCDFEGYFAARLKDVVGVDQFWILDFGIWIVGRPLSVVRCPLPDLGWQLHRITDHRRLTALSCRLAFDCQL